MSAILAVPHSNADCERVFSLVRKTRTEARSSMSNETLEVTAVHSGPCYSQQFSSEMLSKAKSATRLALAAAASSAGDSCIQHDTD